MVRRKRIYHLVCSNGLGHFKRTTEIWSRLINMLDVEVSIGCEKWQYQISIATKPLNILRESEMVEFVFLNMEGSLRWHEDLSTINFESYKKSLRTITNSKGFNDADLVISDNLAGVIGCHNNVILVGSFLWHDVLENSFKKGLEHIMSYEKELLEKHRTLCISVREIAMPAVINSTNNVGLNWFCDDAYDRSEVVAKEQWKVLFSTGLSGAENQRLRGLFDDFMADKSLEVYGTPAFKKQFGLENERAVLDFNFTENAFKDMDLLVTRPGIGSITEAIKYRIPIVAVDNGCNTEMIYNAKRIVELGIGWNALEYNISIYEIKASYASVLNNLKNRPINGFDQFREILKNHLNG